jgi:hypothetical protein
VQEVTKLGSSAKDAVERFSSLDAMMRQAFVGSAQWAAELDVELEQIAGSVLKLIGSSDQYWKTLEAGMYRTRVAIGVATDEVKKHDDAWTKAGKQVSTVLTDMSRGIADVILKGRALGEVFTQAFMEIARAALRYVIEEALGGIARAIGNLIKGEVANLGQAFSGLFKQIEDIGHAIARVFGGGGATAKTPAGASAGGGRRRWRTRRGWRRIGWLAGLRNKPRVQHRRLLPRAAHRAGRRAHRGYDPQHSEPATGAAGFCKSMVAVDAEPR